MCGKSFPPLLKFASITAAKFALRKPLEFVIESRPGFKRWRSTMLVILNLDCVLYRPCYNCVGELN